MLRIGLFGPGWWCRRYLAPALRSAPGVQIAAVCGRDPRRAGQAAESMGVPAAYTDLDAMLGEVPLDALVISSPPSSHLGAVRSAAARGVHVFCEKPLGRDGAETAEMVTAAAGVHSVVGFTQRWHPGVATLRGLLPDIGEIRHFRYHTASVMSADATAPWDWRYDSAEYSYGILSDLGAHAVDLVRWLAGEVVAVNATARTVFDRRPTGDGGTRRVHNWDDCVVTARLDSGAHANLVTSRVLPISTFRRFRHDLDIVGTGGSLSFTSDRPTEVVLARGGSAEVVHADGPDIGDAPPGSYAELMAVNAYASARQVADMCAAFAGRAGAGVPTLADGHAGQLVLDAAARSVREGAWVDC